jgi:hypothetical protein
VRERLVRDGFFILAAVFVGLRLAGVQPWDRSVDAYAYWTTRSGDLYGAANVGVPGAYLYSPAFAQLISPLTALPWNLFLGVLTAINLAAYRILAGPKALLWLLFLPFALDIVTGNVHLLFALAVVLGFGYPAAWALILLTKVTPGVGLVWFAVRREWRSLAVALGASVAIGAVSWLVAPTAWSDWVRTLSANQAGPESTPGWYLPIPLVVRLIAAAVVVAWGGFTDRRWTVPVAVTLALPVVWLNGLAVLAAVIPLSGASRPAWLRLPRLGAPSVPSEGVSP